MAAELLPRESPATSSDWIGYHIRGMMYLKSGDVENAIAVFTWGVQQNPFHRERQLFEAGLAAAKIRKGEFSEAARLTEQLTGPISQILLMHSSAEIGNSKLALQAMSAVNDNQPPSIILLRDVLAARYRLTNNRFDRDDKWILEQESEVLLQAA